MLGESIEMPSSRRIYGTTWDVYLHILTSERAQGVREIRRHMEFSSPSLAQYHVNKLLDLGLIKTTLDGKYEIDEAEKMDILRSFIIYRGKLIPRLVFYGALLMGIFFVYMLYWPFRWDFRDLVVIAISLFSISAFIFEAYFQHKSLVENNFVNSNNDNRQKKGG